MHTSGLAFLELTAVVVSFMLLHSMKPMLGSGVFYVALGTSLVFSQILTATGLQIEVGQTMTLELGTAVFFPPMMAALLITYVLDGTLAAQRLIAGIAVAAGLFIFLSYLSELQCGIRGFALPPVVPGIFLQDLLQEARRFMVAALLANLVQFLVLPIVYQAIRLRGFGVTASVFGALTATQVLDTFFYELVAEFPSVDWWYGLAATFAAKAVAMIWVALLTSLYIRQYHSSGSGINDARRPFDLISDLLSQAGRRRRLQASVREWEGRYRMVVESTSDLIILADEQGEILDANQRALSFLERSLEELAGVSTSHLFEDHAALDWKDIWGQVHVPSGGNFIAHDLRLATPDKSAVVDLSVSALTLRERPAMLLTMHDVTRRHELEGEREELRERFVYLERMEAVGKLAGGVAHDFNNLLHAIQGSLDYMARNADDPAVRSQSLENIAVAADRAETLTQQLLGYARGGKYEVQAIDVASLVRQTEALFRPMLGEHEMRVVVHPDAMHVEGDLTQLQQVVLNLLLNALEALPETGRIVMRAEPIGPHTPGADQPGVNACAYVIRVRDNGAGMTEEVRSRIFEPFFTTKSDKGTGMGLAMVFGCVENHHGYVHVQSELGQGTEFFIFLPKAPGDPS